MISWLRCLGEVAEESLTRTIRKNVESARVPGEWRSVLVLIFKNKGDVQRHDNYRGIKLMSHTMKISETLEEARPWAEVSTCEHQYGFMPRNENYRCNICFEDADREVGSRSEGAVLCLWRILRWRWGCIKDRL